ncbi:helix-turn-helix domain-containing protein [Rapidithrix thailandica]|uniref:Helix-turn-helix domain-containing protein n=1 Tax=Rapidithrix thailandica TaxID=413964 RepID=A0AAW9SDT5_9BACT
MDILVSVASFQAFVSFLLLTTHKSKSTFDRILVYFLMLMMAHLGTKFFVLVILQNEYIFHHLVTGFGFAYGPFAFLATKKLMEKSVKKYEAFLHFAPFFIISLLYLWVVMDIDPHHPTGLTWVYTRHIPSLEMFSFTAYNLFSLYLLYSFHQKSNTDQLQKQLMILICSLLLLLVLSGFGLHHLTVHIFQGVSVLNVRIAPYSILLLISILIIHYKFKVITLKEEKPVVSEEVIKKYEKSGLQATDINKYQRQLDKHMLFNKPYLDSELTLSELAEQLAMPRHHLTQLLSSRYQQSFYQFINEYRIKEATEIMKAQKMNGNFLNLAHEVGFNSKSSFNNYFKKITGKTPSDFKNQLNS